MKYRIWSIEHNAWWKENEQGYTKDKKSAGIYDLLASIGICIEANQYVSGNIPNEAMVPVESEDK